VKEWIDRALVPSAPHLRVFADPQSKLELAESRKLSIGGLEECDGCAGGIGIFLSVENHGGIAAEPDDLMEIVHTRSRVKSSWAGTNLDTGNAHTDDLCTDLARCVPYGVLRASTRCILTLLRIMGA